MKRTALTNNSGAWFNRDSSVKFDEDTRWNGNNHISVSTGSQWSHQALYYTRGGRWILNEWSQWQGSLETYEQIEESAAVDWLVVNGCDLDGLPAIVRTMVEQSIESAEL